jgi:hypothetical protein
MNFFKSGQQIFSDWPDAVLSGALLVAAAIIIYVALQPGEKLAKALVLAYVIFP